MASKKGEVNESAVAGALEKIRAAQLEDIPLEERSFYADFFSDALCAMFRNEDFQQKAVRDVNRWLDAPYIPEPMEGAALNAVWNGAEIIACRSIPEWIGGEE